MDNWTKEKQRALDVRDNAEEVENLRQQVSKIKRKQKWLVIAAGATLVGLLSVSIVGMSLFYQKFGVVTVAKALDLEPSWVEMGMTGLSLTVVFVAAALIYYVFGIENRNSAEVDTLCTTLLWIELQQLTDEQCIAASRAMEHSAAARKWRNGRVARGAQLTPLDADYMVWLANEEYAREARKNLHELNGFAS